MEASDDVKELVDGEIELDANTDALPNIKDIRKAHNALGMKMLWNKPREVIANHGHTGLIAIACVELDGHYYAALAEIRLVIALAEWKKKVVLRQPVSSIPPHVKIYINEVRLNRTKSDIIIEKPSDYSIPHGMAYSAVFNYLSAQKLLDADGLLTWYWNRSQKR